MSADSTARFSDRAQAYARARPGYPDQIVELLVTHFGLPPGAVVADLGSGTGLSCEPFLRAGLQVIGVEPNAAMRVAGEAHLATVDARGAFRSVDGTAEATGLAPASVDLVIAAQAAHWFDAPRARVEAKRISRLPPAGALIWNDRRSTGSDFAVGYEQLLVEFGTDYADVRHRHALPDLVDAFFGHAATHAVTIENPSALDYPTLEQRLLSASYMPAAGAPTYAPMLAALRALFNRTQTDGVVTMHLDTRVFFGTIV